VRRSWRNKNKRVAWGWALPLPQTLLPTKHSIELMSSFPQMTLLTYSLQQYSKYHLNNTFFTPERYNTFSSICTSYKTQYTHLKTTLHITTDQCTASQQYKHVSSLFSPNAQQHKSFPLDWIADITTQPAQYSIRPCQSPLNQPQNHL
jgi:hypothetical protein